MFSEKKVLITGGSEGIGFATAKQFLAQGASVVITGRSAEKLAVAAEKLHSTKLFTLVWDVKDFDRLSEKFAEAVRMLGGLDILVNNAGLAADVDFQGNFMAVTPEKWDLVMDTNLKSMFFICQEAIRLFLPKHAGRIVNVCSEQAFRPGALTPYPISKIGVDYLTRGLGMRYIKDGIIINAVGPGATNTPLQPSEKLISADNIAQIILFLASDTANIIAGETLVADRCEHLGIYWER